MDKMRQDTFENKVKAKLENRKLTPGEDAWSKLEVMLDKEDKKSSNYRLMTYVSAACLLLLVSFIGYKYFSNSNLEEPSNQLVKEELKIEENTPIKQEVPIEQEVVVESIKEVNNDLPPVKTKKVRQYKTVNTQLVNKQELAVNIKKEQLPNHTKTNESVKEIKLSDNELDNLLADAMTTIAIQDSINTLENADDLLAEVEEDIELFSNAEASNTDLDEDDVSIKSKIFKKIKKEFKKTKVTRSPRND